MKQTNNFNLLLQSRFPQQYDATTESKKSAKMATRKENCTIQPQHILANQSRKCVGENYGKPKSGKQTIRGLNCRSQEGQVKTRNTAAQGNNMAQFAQNSNQTASRKSPIYQYKQ